MLYTIKDLKNQLASGAVSPVYLLFGGESFLQKESLKMIIQTVIKSEEYKDFNYNEFDCAGSFSAVGVLEAVETLPVFANRRLVVCSSAHLLKEKDWNILLPILEKPAPSSVLVFLSAEWDRRKKFSKRLIDRSFAVENKQSAGKDLIQWVRWLGRRQGLEISYSAIQLIIRLAGPSLMSIDNELVKIKTFAGSRTLIGEEDILKVTARVRPENVFSFTQALGRQDVKKSFHYLVHLMEDQQNDIGLLSLVARHIRLLSQIKQGLREGLSSSQISSKTGIPSFFLKDYIQQISLWDDKKIYKVTEILHATDRALKSSPLSSDIWMENFILKACSL